MFPLLVRDELVLPYVATLLIYTGVLALLGALHSDSRFNRATYSVEETSIIFAKFAAFKRAGVVVRALGATHMSVAVIPHQARRTIPVCP
jgi:hypothetical protein